MKLVHQRILTWLIVWGVICTSASSTHAYATDVGLGIAAGLNYSPTQFQQDGQLVETVGYGLSWGFFVDIPLTETFYISPATLLYELDLGTGKKPVTDVDLNFKFMMPIGAIRLGTGVITGITNAAEQYSFHYGALGYASMLWLTNFETFVMLQLKRIELTSPGRVDDLHGYLGGMFHF